MKIYYEHVKSNRLLKSYQFLQEQVGIEENLAVT